MADVQTAKVMSEVKKSFDSQISKINKAVSDLSRQNDVTTTAVYNLQNEAVNVRNRVADIEKRLLSSPQSGRSRTSSASGSSRDPPPSRPLSPQPVVQRSRTNLRSSTAQSSSASSLASTIAPPVDDDTYETSRNSIGFTKIIYDVNETSQKLMDLVRDFMKNKLKMKASKVEGMAMTKAERQPRDDDLANSPVIATFALVEDRDEVIRLMSKVPYGSEDGQMFAVYPTQWQGLRKHKEEIARLIRDHKVNGSRTFLAQIRYSDMPSGIEVYVRREQKGQPWRPLWSARSAFAHTNLLPPLPDDLS